MDHNIVITHRPGQSFQIIHVTANDMQTLIAASTMLFEMPLPPGRKIVKERDFPHHIRRKESVGEVAPYKPRAASQEIAGLIIHF